MLGLDLLPFVSYGSHEGSTLTSMRPADDLILTHHTSTEAAKLMGELCEVYADAYGAAPGEDTRENPKVS